MVEKTIFWCLVAASVVYFLEEEYRKHFLPWWRHRSIARRMQNIRTQGNAAKSRTPYKF